MREADVAQSTRVEQAFHLRTYHIKESGMASVNEGGELIADDKLIERNGRFTGPHSDAEDLRGYFIDTGFHGCLLHTEGYTVCAYIIIPARFSEPGNV